MYKIYSLRLKMVLGLASLFFSSLVFAAVPEIQGISGALTDGQVITLTGKNLTTKANAKPLLFWSADGGLNPSALGRKTAWEGTFNGELVDKAQPGVVVAEGATKALRHNYDLSEGAILSRVHFDSDQLYVWRKRYDDFDRLKDMAIRTRYAGLEGTNEIKVGMWMCTTNPVLPTQKLKAKVIKTFPAVAGVGVAYYSNTEGNLTDPAVVRLVPRGQALSFYNSSDCATPLFSVKLDEGSGIFHTFNHKIFRLWGQYGAYNNNSYISLDKDGMMHSEYTGISAYWNAGWEHPIFSATKRWVVEEFQYQAGTLDQVDGILFYWQDRLQGWSKQRFRFITSTATTNPAYPHKYSDVYQNQVSNGAQPLSYEYFDSLYIDDTWHRVLACAESTWSACKQPEIAIPTAWGDEQIKFSLRLGGLKNKANFYLYVVNGLGEVNEKGFATCPLCPLPPIPKK